MASAKIRKAGGGRPPKFRESRKPITVTLPERVLRALELVNPDRAVAIVKCVEAVIGTGSKGRSSVELVEVLPGKSLIVVGSCRSLRQLEWLRLVEIAPARFLLILPAGMPVERLEVELNDLLDDLGPAEVDERALLARLREIVVQQRRQKTVSKAEMLFVDVKRNS